jgi:hypothetical protein
VVHAQLLLPVPATAMNAVQLQTADAQPLHLMYFTEQRRTRSLKLHSVPGTARQVRQDYLHLVQYQFVAVLCICSGQGCSDIWHSGWRHACRRLRRQRAGAVVPSAYTAPQCKVQQIPAVTLHNACCGHAPW